MPSREFLRPRLRGRRFDDGGIPLDFLSDLAVLQKMVLEVAKWRFLQSNPGYQRTPRGFTKDVHLKVTELVEGNSVTPVITLSTAEPPSLFPQTTLQECLDEAIEYIINAMNAPEESAYSTANGALPIKYLAYFDRIGRNLQDGEAIDFSIPSGRASATLDQAKRRTLLAASRIRELTQEVTLRGSVSEADQDRMTFELQPVYGNKVSGPIPEQHLDTIIEAFNGYRNGIRVLVQGVGRHDRQNRLLSLESIEHISTLEPLDVAARLDEFRDMRDGWLEGTGIAPSHAGLDWLAESFELFFPPYAPLPYTYPTPTGGVQMEWSLGNKELSLEVDIADYGAEWYSLDMVSLESDERSLDLRDADSWIWFADRLRDNMEADVE